MRRVSGTTISLFSLFLLLILIAAKGDIHAPSRDGFFNEPETDEYLPLGESGDWAQLETATLANMGIDVKVVDGNTVPKKKLTQMDKRVFYLVNQVKLSSAELSEWLKEKNKPVVLGITQSHKKYFLENHGLGAICIPMPFALVIFLKPYKEMLLACGKEIYSSVVARLIKNELFHIYIYAKNSGEQSVFEQGLMEANSAYPFLDEKGQIDLVKLDLFAKSLRAFVIRIYQLKKLFLNKEYHHPTIKKVTQALEGYHQTHEVFRMRSKLFKQGRLEKKIGERFFSPNIKYQFKKPAGSTYFNHTHKIVKRQRVGKNQLLCLSRFFGNGALASLLSDFSEIEFLMTSDNYYHLKPYPLWLTELGSFIAAFPSAVTVLLAPELCGYMAKYLGVLNFCNGRKAGKLPSSDQAIENTDFSNYML
jgi:hypothetical protein